ncbi:MAG: MFS transporter [Cyclobacteriaceae bacterium]
MKKLIPTRFLMVLGTFLLSLLLYIDRINISVAQDNIADDLDITGPQMGWIMSIFALGYALAQVPSGKLADKYGPRSILSIVVSFWSLFTFLTGAAWNFISLFITRLLFGVGEAGAFPGMAKAVYKWIPVRERGIVTGINFSGSRIGAAFALPMVAWMIATLGWRMSFMVLGGIGFVWAAIWYWWFRTKPEDHPGISKEELNHILNTRQKERDQKDQTGLPFLLLLKSKNMWLAMGQYFASNFTFFFCLSWMFSHLKEKYMLDALEAGWYSSAPLIAGAFGNYFAGWLVDYLFKTKGLNVSRKIPAIVGFLLASIGILMSMQMDTPASAIIFFSLAIFGADMTLSPSWSFCVDIGREHSGAVSGTMNMAGNLGSFITALAFPYLLSWTGSPDPFFYIAALLNALAIVFWLMTKPESYVTDF